MSSQSPSVVLYTSAGVELDVQTGTAIPTGTGAILVSGITPAGNATWNPASSDGILGITQMANHQVAQSAATVTTSGSFTTTLMYAGAQEMALVVDVGTVTGAGTITYTIQEIDTVGNLYGNTASTSTISSANAPAVFTAVLNITTAMNFRVTWTVTGTFSATITSYVVSKSTPSTQTINGTITTTNNSVGSDGAAALAFDTQVGGKVTTAAPTYTTGNLNALSLTTLGGLRIDGVYAVGTADATAADVMNSGGYVTTAAPTYTTGQLNPLSLTTAGSLRVDGTGGTFNNQSVGTDAAAALGFDTQVGGKVTTAAPTYTTGNLDALSLTTSGQLRIDSVYPTGTATASAPDATEMGGIVVTSAPTYTSGQLNALTLDVGGNLRVITNKAGTSNITSVTATTASQTLLASNTSRVFASIYNGGSRNAYIVLSSTAASTTNFSIQLLTGSYWEFPVDYIGQINIIWSTVGASSLTGTALVTELTP
jgi:trimeric autotransporter adhesin